MNAVLPWSELDDPESDGERSSGPPEERERVVGRALEQMDAMLAQRATPAPARAARPPGSGRPTLRLPVNDADPRPQGIRAAPVAHNDVTPTWPPAFPMPPVVRAPAALTRTELAKDRPAAEWAQQGRLPFHPAPPRVPPSGWGIAGTLQLREMGLGTGKTAPLGDTGIAQACAATPFVTSTGGVVNIPLMTPRQYASLRAELAFAPDRPGAVLPRYGV